MTEQFMTYPSTSRTGRRLIISLFIIGTNFLSSCSPSSHPTLVQLFSSDTTQIPSLTSQGFTPYGAVIMSKMVPSPSEVQNVTKSASMNSTLALGKAVGYNERSANLVNQAMAQLPSAGPTVRVNLGSKIISVNDGTSDIFSTSFEGSIKDGLYAVKEKSFEPAWYASDDYFIRRGLQVPAENDVSNRVRKGALGKQALLLSQNAVIHSGRVWTPEIGGLRVEESQLSQLMKHISETCPVVVVR